MLACVLRYINWAGVYQDKKDFKKADDVIKIALKRVRSMRVRACVECVRASGCRRSRVCLPACMRWHIVRLARRTARHAKRQGLPGRGERDGLQHVRKHPLPARRRRRLGQGAPKRRGGAQRGPHTRARGRAPVTSPIVGRSELGPVRSGQGSREPRCARRASSGSPCRLLAANRGRPLLAAITIVLSCANLPCGCQGRERAGSLIDVCIAAGAQRSLAKVRALAGLDHESRTGIFSAHARTHARARMHARSRRSCASERGLRFWLRCSDLIGQRPQRRGDGDAGREVAAPRWGPTVAGRNALGMVGARLSRCTLHAVCTREQRPAATPATPSRRELTRSRRSLIGSDLVSPPSPPQCVECTRKKRLRRTHRFPVRRGCAALQRC